MAFPKRNARKGFSKGRATCSSDEFQVEEREEMMIRRQTKKNLIQRRQTRNLPIVIEVQKARLEMSEYNPVVIIIRKPKNLHPTNINSSQLRSSVSEVNFEVIDEKKPEPSSDEDELQRPRAKRQKKEKGQLTITELFKRRAQT